MLGTKIKENLEDLKNFYVLNILPATAQLLKARVLDENGTVSINSFFKRCQQSLKQYFSWEI